MTEDEIIDYIRRGIREPKARKTGATGISQSITEAIAMLAELLAGACPEYFQKTVSLQSSNNLRFALPSDNQTLLRAWDMDTTAGDITGAADNGSGLVRITQVAHGFSTGNVVRIHDVAGTTEANGLWKITKIDADTYDLQGSVFASAYTSGGKAFREYEDAYKYPLTRQPAGDKSLADETKYSQDGAYIVVDDDAFENDLIILYRYLPSTLAEIPDKFHPGIGAFGVIDQMKLPKTDDPSYSDLSKSLQKHSESWAFYQGLASAFKPFGESKNVSDVNRFKRFI